MKWLKTWESIDHQKYRKLSKEERSTFRKGMNNEPFTYEELVEIRDFMNEPKRRALAKYYRPFKQSAMLDRPFEPSDQIETITIKREKVGDNIFFIICKLQDDWFVVIDMGLINLYLCDELEGLLQCIDQIYITPIHYL